MKVEAQAPEMCEIHDNNDSRRLHILKTINA